MTTGLVFINKLCPLIHIEDLVFHGISMFLVFHCISHYQDGFRFAQYSIQAEDLSDGITLFLISEQLNNDNKYLSGF